MKNRIVFAVSGASGAPLAAAALKFFAGLDDLEVFLIVSRAARLVMSREGGAACEDYERLATRSFGPEDFAAPMASGSWQNAGMIVCPCSMSSLAAIATGAGTNLIHRAADVALKERRPLILAIRETPYSLIHIRNMLAATEAGATIMPFNPAYYSGDDTLEGLARQFAGRLLDQLRLPHNLCRRWGEN
ncbi:MAG: UbiX family flavin prenyltransferase [Desulfovibrio sp.]|nr:UbiX family flavin prenyltransferase [Desulfovibrio sp.]